MFDAVREVEVNPPVYFVVAWRWRKVLGEGEVALRALSALLGTATVPVVYAAARELASRRAGLDCGGPDGDQPAPDLVLAGSPHVSASGLPVGALVHVLRLLPEQGRAAVAASAGQWPRRWRWGRTTSPSWSSCRRRRGFCFGHARARLTGHAGLARRRVRRPRAACPIRRAAGSPSDPWWVDRLPRPLGPAAGGAAAFRRRPQRSVAGPARAGRRGARGRGVAYALVKADRPSARRSLSPAASAVAGSLLCRRSGVLRPRDYVITRNVIELWVPFAVAVAVALGARAAGSWGRPSSWRWARSDSP